MSVINGYCFLIRKDLEEMNIKQEGDKVRYSFRPDQVESIREMMQDNDIVTDECMVYFKSSQSLVVAMSFDELHKLVFGHEPQPEMLSQ